MAYVIVLFLTCVFSARARISVSEYEIVISKQPYTESRKVLTTMGKECKFPFRQGGRMHHHCITVLLSRPWCSLTHNFDRDRTFGFCAPETSLSDGVSVVIQTSHRIPGPCQGNPCKNGGICEQIANRLPFKCSCPESFTGRLCEQRKCYETLHLRFYDTGESWGRIHRRTVEQCTCVAGEMKCVRVHYTMCSSNPCQNGGTCRLITATRKEVCNCRMGYSGPDCSYKPEAECYNSRGKSYRGVVNTTESGALCLPWNSDLLHHELHMGTVVTSRLNGLGEHAFCRNPDGDRMPWCYTISDSAISWEYCDVPSCRTPLFSLQGIIPNNIPGIEKPKHSRAAKRPVCGTKHRKSLLGPKGRILGGTTALPGSHPWMAAIYGMNGQLDFCAGTLISACWVVSAAHCFFRNPLMSQLRVVFGQHRFNVTDPKTTFEVEDYIFPKQFSVFNPTLHDIVLIKLKKKNGRCMRRTPYVRPICLPDKGMMFPDGYCCAISGWGHMYESQRRGSGTEPGYSTLQEAGVRLISNAVCRKPNVYGNHVTTNMVCAGLNGCADACQGDSGGPLACARNGVSFLYGVISWGHGCGRSDKPGVYTKVVNYIDWINSVIRRKQSNS